jgi:hypothetical protein
MPDPVISKIEDYEKADCNLVDMTLTMGMRYRLKSDPDDDTSYTDVTATKNFSGVIVHDFAPDVLGLAPGTYVLHIYYLDNVDCGTKIDFVVTGIIPV